MRKLVIAAAAALAAIPAAAQDRALAEGDVRTFITQSVDQAQQMVRAGDWAGIQSWYRDHLAEDARIATKASVVSKDGPTMTFTMAMDARDLHRFGAMMSMGPQQGGKMPIEEFSLEAEVYDVIELPGGAASAIVMFSESGVLQLPAMAEGAEAAEGEPSTEPVVFHTASTCTLRFAAEGDNAIVIEVAACDSTTTAG